MCVHLFLSYKLFVLTNNNIEQEGGKFFVLEKVFVLTLSSILWCQVLSSILWCLYSTEHWFGGEKKKSIIVNTQNQVWMYLLFLLWTFCVNSLLEIFYF